MLAPSSEERFGCGMDLAVCNSVMYIHIEEHITKKQIIIQEIRNLDFSKKTNIHGQTDALNMYPVAVSIKIT